MLCNIGFVEALKIKAWDCFVFHDVDHYPEDYYFLNKILSFFCSPKHRKSYFLFRAMLCNIGFVEALKIKEWDCFVFHDVDHYPEDLR